MAVEKKLDFAAKVGFPLANYNETRLSFLNRTRRVSTHYLVLVRFLSGNGVFLVIDDQFRSSNPLRFEKKNKIETKMPFSDRNYLVIIWGKKEPFNLKTNLGAIETKDHIRND